MNKLVLLLFTFFIIKISFCQMPIDETTGDIQYKEVVQISDINDSTAYNRAKKWMLSNLKTSDQMTETSNDSELRLVGTINILLDTSIILGKGIILALFK